MQTDLLLALATFALVSSITPGPNNMMLLASGANYGIVRSLPHMIGVNIGFIAMIFLIGLGVGQIVTADPRIHFGFQLACLLYLLWLAWRIANAGPISAESTETSGRPLSFFEAALFQWINPKAWAMALTATATFTRPDQFLWSLGIVCIVFAIINLPSIGIWTGFGAALRPVLQDPLRARVLNMAMAIALLASVWPTVRELVAVF